MALSRAAASDILIRLPEIAPCRFLDAYGRPNRQALPERSNQPNLAQALHMLAGSTYTEKISQKGGRVDRLAASAKAGVYYVPKEDVTQGYIAQLESGLRKNPSLPARRKLARALGVPVTELLE